MYDQEKKADAGKLRLDLIPAEAVRALGEVLTYGAERYGPYTWSTVEPERYEAAMLRHFLSWKEGELYDPESGLHHLKHVLCNAAFLVALKGQEGNEEEKPEGKEGWDWARIKTNHGMPVAPVIPSNPFLGQEITCEDDSFKVVDYSK